MPPKYIAGYDGSDASLSAVHFAVRLATAMGAEAVAVNSYTPVEFIYGKGASRVPVNEINADARADAQETLAELDELVSHRVVTGRSPAHALQQLAETEEVSLIAVGLTHHHAPGRLVPGSVGEHLLHGAPCPVLVVPPGIEEDAVQSIGVAFDASDESVTALRTAAALAQRLGARLVLLTAIEPPWWYPQAFAYEDTLDSIARERFDRARAESGLDVTYETRRLVGPAQDALVKASRKDIDLLVMGSRGYGPLRSVLLGSVSRHVIDHAPCPVMVVPRGAHTGLEPGVEPAASAHA